MMASLRPLPNFHAITKSKRAIAQQYNFVVRELWRYVKCHSAVIAIAAPFRMISCELFTELAIAVFNLKWGPVPITRQRERTCTHGKTSQKNLFFMIFGNLATLPIPGRIVMTFSGESGQNI